MVAWIAGIDEAGRGPVVGSMIVCAFALPDRLERKLADLGVRDSKQLSASRREDLSPKILEMGKAAVVETTAADLNVLMKRQSLNDIEARSMAEALIALEKDAQLERVYVDSPDPVLSTFENRLRRFYHGSAELVCDHRADQKYPVVSAASVIAKVRRDETISRLAKKVGEDFGSGYSHDARTISFLKKHWLDKSHPIHAHVRSEWATAKNLRVIQFKLGDFV